MAPSAKHADLGVEIGEVFLGKYRVDAILGQGGMGIVAQCHHLQLDERVAIKMLKPDVLADQDAVQRFTREAQAAAKLKSEYVARVVDVGTFETGVPYMVMEFLDGQDLGQMIDGGKLLSVPLMVDLAIQACEALSEAHYNGIVHRDVKPTNLFVIWRADKPWLKVLDFGISKSSTAHDLKLTQTQSLLGTPAYMSPEQMRSAREVDARTDLWSLGTVIYEAIEGRRPFEADSFSEMVVKVSMEPPTPMRNAPVNLQQVIMRCLCKQPDQRYQSMAELARDLIPFAQDPHTAQLLVERMYRTLRRSQAVIPTDGYWEGGTGPGQPKLQNWDGVPQSAQQAPGSQPVMTQHGVGLPPAAPGAVVQPMPHAASQPVAAMSIGWQGGVLDPAQSAWAGGSQAGAEPWHGVTGTDPAGRPMSGIHDAPRMTTPTPVARPVPLSVKVGVLAFAGVLGAMIAILSAGGKDKDKGRDATATGEVKATVKVDTTPTSTGSAAMLAPVVSATGSAMTVTPPAVGSAAPATATPPTTDTGAGSGADINIDLPQPDKHGDTPTRNPPRGGNTGNSATSGNGGNHLTNHNNGGGGNHGQQTHRDTTKPKTPPDSTTPNAGTSTTGTNTTATTTSTPAGAGSATTPNKTDGKHVYTCPNGHPVEEYSHGCP